jgi:hypothetical protein
MTKMVSEIIINLIWFDREPYAMASMPCHVFTNLGLKPKTEQNPTGKKQSQTEKLSQNRAKPEKTKSNRFEPVFILKNQTESKPVGLNQI